MIATLALSIVPVKTHAVSEAVMIGMMSSMADAYGMSYGIGTTYDVTSTNGVTESFQGLWDDFSAYQTSQGKPSKTLSETWVTMQARNDRMAQRYESTFEHQSGNFVAYDYDEETAGVFDEFWNWLLKIHVGLTVDENQYQWNTDENGNVVNETIFISITSTINGKSAHYLPFYSKFQDNRDITLSSTSDDKYALVQSIGDGNYNYWVLSPTEGRFTYRIQNPITGIEIANDSKSLRYDNETGWYWNYINVFSSTYTGIVDFTSSSYNIATNFGSLLDDSIANENSSTSVNPYRNATITLPDISAEDYTPTATTVVTDQNWNDNRYGDIFPLPDDALANLVDDSLELASTNELELLIDEAIIDPIVPSPEYNPLLPSNLPSFNFSFSGIWHYVVEWVATLGDWFTAMFSMWSALPYAMVLPVYATAVIVIVLGVYKRFFM